MSWWKAFYFIVGIIILIAGVQNKSWWQILTGVLFLYLGIKAK